MEAKYAASYSASMDPFASWRARAAEERRASMGVHDRWGGCNRQNLILDTTLEHESKGNVEAAEERCASMRVHDRWVGCTIDRQAALVILHWWRPQR